jgi:hypothetical protein
VRSVAKSVSASNGYRLHPAIVLGALLFSLGSVTAWGQVVSSGSSGTVAEISEPSGQHDFDFLFGTWKIHNRRLLHPLSGSNEWVEFDATDVVRPLWSGRGNIDEFEADAPSGHVEGLTVRLYNEKTGQWSLYWATQKRGEFSLPATVGRFKNGRGEFYDREVWSGKHITVRFLWTVLSADTYRWEQAFSTDSGKTWETNWVMQFTRDKR